MKQFFYKFLIITGSLILTDAVEWKTPVHQLGRVKSALQDRAARVKSAVIEEVRTADIRLKLKDPIKQADTHPLLSSAEIDESHASSIFETGWINFYTWVSDVETEYKPVGEADELFLSKHYDSTQDTLLILHDACGSYKDASVLKIIEALKLRNFDVNYNILIMDFAKLMCHKLSAGTGMLKMGVNPQLKLLAIEIGEFLFRGMRIGKIHAKQINLLGLGVSTPLAALIAKHTRELSDQKINSILGLDPPVSLRKSLFNSDNAHYTHVYHTFKLVPGTVPSIGHVTADFVFGGAKRVPQCNKSIKSSCFKGFGVQLFVSTLLFPKLFPARWCPNYHKFMEHFCDFNDYTYLSFPPDKSANGTYEMEIDYSFPFGRGLDGIFEKAEEEVDHDAESSELAKLSEQEYLHRLEIEVSIIRSELLSCIHGVMTPAAVMRCLMTAQPSVRRLEKKHMIKKISCETFHDSPTGRKCAYMTRTNNAFELPF